MWGISDTFADILFRYYSISSEALVSMRMLFAGMLILLYTTIVRKEKIFAVFQNKSDTISLLLFGIVGMVGCQFFFFKSIAINGASLATILQFTSPIVIYFYLLLRKENKLNVVEIFLIFLTFFGVMLILTTGSASVFSILGLLIGGASAFGAAFYTVQPRMLLKKYGSPVIVGWGMLFGGLAFQFIHPFWQLSIEVTLPSILLLLGIIVLGTAVAFISYLSSMAYIEAPLASVLTALEPLVASLLAVMIFGKSFGFLELLGIALVLIAVTLLSFVDRKIKSQPEEEPHEECGTYNLIPPSFIHPKPNKRRDRSNFFDNKSKFNKNL
ncbi:DMT family transporter [Enterococcus sp. 9E7_DIV0242]|uniref:EamA domain-containing protein n=1 Tax=Candidatus Enterococcus clewellii TaxID=1834193 RepID=A0A242KCG4_9ENTE|nr:hypothetical protein A5888_000678 [Enterococcus sp. 9E7_DIV0242]